ncbi:MAG TPA: hypothetical protein VD947_01825 [Patescibacteria group bacterium]|nr:hypothetical protein [Patescibacteria group bacterium]
MLEKTNTSRNLDSLRQQLAQEKIRLANPGAFATMNSVTRPRQPLEDEPFISAGDMADASTETGQITVTDTRPHLEAVPTLEEPVGFTEAEVASPHQVSDFDSPKVA